MLKLYKKHISRRTEVNTVSLTAFLIRVDANYAIIYATRDS